MTKLSHIDEQGRATMVDVGEKAETKRVATASGLVRMKPETLKLIQEGNIKKGDVLSVARVAGIMAAKKTSDLIPLCHPLPITSVNVDFDLDSEESLILITATAKVDGKTGVEMEALTAASVAALTIYDMAKAVDKDMEIGDIKLLHKEGGKSGTYHREEKPQTQNTKPALKSRAMRLTPTEVMSSTGMAPSKRVLPTEKREALKTYVRQNNIKVTSWAAQAGVRSGEVFGFLNGQSSSISDETSQKLASALGVSVETLFQGKV